MKFDSKDINRLRELAKKVNELSNRPIEEIKREKWFAINELRSNSPVVFADPENGWNEIITDKTAKCENELARNWEKELLRKIFWAEKIKDDRVIEPFFDISYIYKTTGWGVDIKLEQTRKDGAYHIIPSVLDYEKDFKKVKFPKIVVDYEKTKKRIELAGSVFGDILEVRNRTRWWWTLGMTWDYINMRGLDNLMMDFILKPKWVHRTMEFLMKGNLEKLDFLESNGLLSNNNDDSYVGSGGFGYIRSELNNQTTKSVRLKDMWGFAESQETVAISPEMFNEFILPYQMKLLKRFGLNCYGCCEPINSRWKYVKNIPNLRRISASPWADKKIMASQLKSNYIMSIKASPMLISTYDINEAEIRKEVRDFLNDTKGCQVEIIMKDNHTIGNNPNNIVRWVEIVREEIYNM